MLSTSMLRLSIATPLLPILLLVGAPVQAKLVPVLRGELAELARRHARLFVARPCRGAYQLDAAARRDKRRLLPGDRLRVKELFQRHNRVVPHTLVVTTGDGVAFRVRVECLSRHRPDYSFRGKGTFEAFYSGLLRDLPRLMGWYVKLVQKHGYKIPITDPATKQFSDDWQRGEAILKQLSWVRNELFAMAYSGRSERSVLRREADWITGRGEAFIRGYAGAAPPEVKAKLKKVYLQLNRLSSVRTAASRVHRLQQEIDKLKGGDTSGSKYRDLEPAHRARLLGEDTAKLQTEQAKWRTKLLTIVPEVRAALEALGIKAR
jgi:hypothetical protein